jgi:hypothetical protein
MEGIIAPRSHWQLVSRGPKSTALKPSRIYSFIVLISVMSASSVQGQEMNYQPFQYGTRSALMGGAAVAGVRDSSAIVYNPAALAMSQETSLSVSANALRAGSMKLHDKLGAGADVDGLFLDALPLIVSGVTKVGDYAVGYGVWTKQQFAITFVD